MNEIKNKAKKLTKNLSGAKARIEIFNFVRDIPYFISSNQNPVDALRNNRANCGQKAKLLASLLNEIGINTKFISMSYQINKLPLPITVLKLAQLKTDYHLAVLAKIKNKWILLDATADSNLKKGGFIVNKWDGLSNTIPFVDAMSTSKEKEFSKKLKAWLRNTKKTNPKKKGKRLQMAGTNILKQLGCASFQ